MEPAPALLFIGRAAFYIAPGAAFVLLHSIHPRTLPEVATWQMWRALATPQGQVGSPYNEEVTLTALLVALVSADWTTWPSFKISIFKVP